MVQKHKIYWPIRHAIALFCLNRYSTESFSINCSVVQVFVFVNNFLAFYTFSVLFSGTPNGKREPPYIRSRLTLGAVLCSGLYCGLLSVFFRIQVWKYEFQENWCLCCSVLNSSMITLLAGTRCFLVWLFTFSVNTPNVQCALSVARRIHSTPSRTIYFRFILII